MSPSCPELNSPILPQCSNKNYWTLDIQNCTFRNNWKHIVAYHIPYTTPWNTTIHRLPTTALKTMNSFFLTQIIQKENAHFPIQILNTKCSARRALGILLLSFLVFRKETIPLFPSSHLWSTAFQLLPILPHIPILPRLPLQHNFMNDGVERYWK